MSMIELERRDPPGAARAAMMLQRAHWAAETFARYDRTRVVRILDAVAEAAEAHAERFAEEAVAETGMGVVEHKILKNRMLSRGLWDHYRDHAFVSPRIDAGAKILELPRPAGVIFALTPVTNPVATVYFKVMLALMTRNAIVVSPHPGAKHVCADAVRMLSDAAVRAGAPDGCIQIVEEPSIPLIEALMTDPTTDVVVATGGGAVVRAAYRSGNPALGVGPGNVPSFVDASADITAAAREIIDSKSFDHSILCTNESVVIVEEEVADQLERELKKHGGHIVDASEVEQVREHLFPNGHMRLDLIGKSALELAEAAQLKVPANTRVLIAPFSLVVPEEPLAHEKLFPLLGLVRVPNTRAGISAAQAMLRITGAGHSASIHSRNARTIMAYGAAVKVLRVSVNVGNSLGSAGALTNLSPTMTIGTGFYGRSSIGENLEPRHLVNLMRVAYNADASVPFDDFTGLEPWVLEAASTTYAAPAESASSAPETDLLREEIRKVILEELKELTRQ
jgi:acyl-CoA reductase-like NAD-dependent aldehyde dehydrogenase